MGNIILSPEEYLVSVVFDASLTAPNGGKLVDVKGTCETSNTPVTGSFTQNITLVSGPGDSSLHRVTVSQLCVVAVDEVPFSVSVVPPTVPLSTDGSLDLTVQVQRNPEFTEPVEVFFPALPPRVEAPNSIVIPGDKKEGVVTLSAQPIGNYLSKRRLVPQLGFKETPSREGKV
jgi:hypothetical protein